MFRFIPTKAMIYAALSAFGAAIVVWLRAGAKRDQRRATTARQSADRFSAIKSKKEIDRAVETQDDTALIDRLTRR